MICIASDKVQFFLRMLLLSAQVLSAGCAVQNVLPASAGTEISISNGVGTGEEMPQMIVFLSFLV